ncbi:MAG: LON peptidase substrate-binding domain-containing protein [Alphaproteobacteria bacterium]
MSQSGADPDVAALPLILPIFPLSDVLLLPGGQLPLNIFEPRYLAMVRDALAGERMVGMVQPCEPAEDVGAAKVYGIGCAGRITAFSETPDGQNSITLTGVIRFEIEHELPSIDGYRRVTADYSRFHGDLDDDEISIDRDHLLMVLGAYFDATGIEGDWAAIKETGSAHLVTSLAMVCPFEGAEKQALLEAVTLRERVAAMTMIMELAAHGTGGPSMHH